MWNSEGGTFRERGMDSFEASEVLGVPRSLFPFFILGHFSVCSFRIRIEDVRSDEILNETANALIMSP